MIDWLHQYEEDLWCSIEDEYRSQTGVFEMVAVNLSSSYSAEWNNETKELTIFSPDGIDALDCEETVNLIRFLDSIRMDIDIKETQS